MFSRSPFQNLEMVDLPVTLGDFIKFYEDAIKKVQR
jgi:hypothetical protein